MIFGLLAETTIPKVTNGKERRVLKQRNNAISNLAPPASKQGFVEQTGSSGGILGNNIMNSDFHVKLSPFTSKKDLVARLYPESHGGIADIF